MMGAGEKCKENLALICQLGTTGKEDIVGYDPKDKLIKLGTRKVSLDYKDAYELARQVEDVMMTARRMEGLKRRDVPDKANELLIGIEKLEEYQQRCEQKKREDESIKYGCVVRNVRRGAEDVSLDETHLRNKYREYVLLGFEQKQFLTGQVGGICFAWVLHWGRRILMKNQPSYLYRKGARGAGESMIFLNDPQITRFSKKVGDVAGNEKAGIAKLQAITGKPIKGFLREQYPRFGEQSDGNSDLLRKYGDLELRKLNDQKVSTRHWAGYGPQKSGGDVLFDAMTIGKNASQDGSGQVWIVCLDGEKKEDSHAIGLHNFGFAHFFDPKIGEFLFREGSAQAARAFFDELWDLLYKEFIAGYIFKTFDVWQLT
jgi:hypothetical protein